MKKLTTKAIIAAILLNIPGASFYQAWAGGMGVQGAQGVKSLPAAAAAQAPLSGTALNLPVAYQFEDVYFKLAGQPGQIYRVPIFQPQVPGQEKPGSIQQTQDLSQAIADISSDRNRSPETLQAQLSAAWKERAAQGALSSGSAVRAPPAASAQKISPAQTVEVRPKAPVIEKAVPQIALSAKKHASDGQSSVLSQVRSAADAALGLAGRMVRSFTGPATAGTLASLLFLMPLPSQAGKLDLASNDTPSSYSAPSLNKFDEQVSEKRSAPAAANSTQTSLRGNLAGRREIGFSLQSAKSVNLNGAKHPDREYQYLAFRWSARFPFLETDHLRIAVEPNIGKFSSSGGGMMVGLNLMPRYYPWLEGRILPFVSAGVGTLVTDSPQLDYPLNFMSLAGAGFDFFFMPRLALELEYRLHHISNAGLRKPNTGINASVASAGLSWHY